MDTKAEAINLTKHKFQSKYLGIQTTSQEEH